MAAPPKKYTTQWTQTPLPPTKRAYGIHLNYGVLNEKNEKNESVKADKICYGTGLLAVVRDVIDPAKISIFAGHKGKVNVVSPSPNGNWVASGDDTGVVNIWGFPQLTLKNTLRIGSGINDIRWSADSEMLVCAGNGSTEFAKAFRFAAQNPLGKIDRMTKQCLSVDWSPIKPGRVALSDEDCTVLFYHGVPFKFDSRSTHHSRYPNVVRFSPDGKYFATVGSDSKIILYNGQTGEKVKEIEDEGNNHTGSIFGLAWHKDSQELVTASADKTVKIWNVESSKCVHTWTSAANTAAGSIDDQQCGVMWSPSEHPVSISLTGNINFWSRDAPAPVKTILGHHSGIQSRIFSRPLKTLFTGDLEGRILATNVVTGATTEFAGEGHTGKPVAALALSADGKTLYSAGYDLTLQQHDAASGKFGKILRTIPVNARDLAVGPDGTLFVSLTNGDLISTKDGADGQKVIDTGADRLRLLENKLYVISPSTKRAAVYNLDLTLAKDQPENQYEAVPGDFVVGKGGRIFSSEGLQVTPWKEDLSGPAAFGWSYHSSNITSLAISPDQTKLVSASLDKSLVFWNDLETLKGSRNLQIRDTNPAGLSFVEWVDNDTIITVSSDSVITCSKIQF